MSAELESRIKELERLVYVPGLLKCKKCGFGLIKTNLYVMDGTFGANNEPDHCPNDGAPMWRVTERDASNEYIDRTESMVLEFNTLRTVAQKVRKHFADSRAIILDGAEGNRSDVGDEQEGELREAEAFIAEIDAALQPPPPTAES